MKQINSSKKINGWDAAYREKPQQFTEPESICTLLDTLFPKYGVKRVLDLGCGNGRHLVYFGKTGYEIHGSDLSGWGLLAAKDWLAKEKLPTRLALADMQYLPYQEGCFDAIISFRVIQHNLLADILGTFKELERMLRPGGLLVIDLLRYDPDSTRWENARLLEERTFAPTKGQEMGMPHHAFTKSEIFHILQRWQIKFFATQRDQKHYTIIAQK